MKSKSNKALIGSGIITAIAASLCCITPVLALIAGTSGMASSFSDLQFWYLDLHGIRNLNPGQLRKYSVTAKRMKKNLSCKLNYF